MSNRHGDINDDEIRVISSDVVKTDKKKSRLLPVILWALALLFMATALIIMFFSSEEIEDEKTNGEVTELPAVSTTTAENYEKVKAPAFIVKTDTVVNGKGLSILTPYNATPVLEIGNEHINDSTIILIAQAADVRGDNGGIVGSFVVNGELMSKGEAKAGFCSIINGDVTVGVADATPMFEQALMSNGYFFRQYPLVVGGQIVENKPKGKALRKALIELDGKIGVAVSREKLTFHDFSQVLTDVGVSNAIYLVGGDSYVRYVDSEGASFTFRNKWDKDIDNVNYIVWR
ncbi:MAG: phosphodiester glycosidase family protein [Muribaculaceae bacterium]|nr:phosphodiester glycosidase family protein [Muribaculaceae bacterium]